ncbi:NAD(P)/FAD-dependent oxidoreductase [Arthrobacter sp. ATA002]|uniref:NAD(P)/FAD-dependent oxidoreductase n=1 Tax=Arthrobacter sp. ATA002 TaxID=2991715 RepID=UPI0022A7ECC4|nr:NAD(P)/FAD-dependent oxidoreductase [Arthrobacter sp. ATA002]WAP52280.1 NAD(P)/FAD-dependent oxidoreductase [Arthrobacter sp. ATA002]
MVSAPGLRFPQYDVVIIGGGIAGLTAAEVLGRARRRVAVVDAGRPRNAPAGHVHGFPSRDGIAPRELLRLCRAELERYDVDLIDAEVTGLAADRTVELEDGRILRGRHAVVASGLRDVLPDIDGAAERWGRDLLQCPYCHGWEVADSPLAVLGAGPDSVQQAFLVRSFSAEVTLICGEGLELSGADTAALAAMGITVVEGTAAGLQVQDDALAAVVLDDGRTVPCRAVFCEPGAAVDPVLSGVPGCTRDADGCLETDEAGRTGADRIWAVGNVTDPSSQVVAAAGDAYRLAVALNAALLEEDVAAAVRAAETAAGPPRLSAGEPAAATR